jgi:uncharacterized SAM-binding protein YcdF (DUF218 family)
MVESLRIISDFLARRDVTTLSEVSPVDSIVLIGSSLVGSVRVAAEARRLGWSDRILIAGGIGHSTQDLRDQVIAHPEFGSVSTEGRAEADIFRDILVDFLGVESDAVTVENQSTNCGANAAESRRVSDLAGGIRSCLLIQDPTMQRRTHASFDRAWSDVDSFRVVSYAPFRPVASNSSSGVLSVSGDSDPIWPFSRFVSLILGEIVRLRDDENGYGPCGKNFIDHVEIPSSVFEAFEQVESVYGARKQ